MDKREFLGQMGKLALALPFLPSDVSANKKESPKSYCTTSNEAFWLRIREDYLLKPDYINLENGYYNFVPVPTMNKYIDHLKMVNYEASYYMRTVQWENKAKVRDRLATLVGSTPKELIIY